MTTPRATQIGNYAHQVHFLWISYLRGLPPPSSLTNASAVPKRLLLVGVRNLGARSTEYGKIGTTSQLGQELKRIKADNAPPPTTEV